MVEDEGERARLIRELREQADRLEAEGAATDPKAELVQAAAGRRAGEFPIWAGVVVGVVALGLFAAWDRGRQLEESEAAAPTGEAVAGWPAPQGWIYNSSVDQMTDGVTSRACVRSNNQVRLEWPYSDVFARLCVRDAPRTGLDVYVALEGEGQIICHGYRNCTIGVRFDSGAAQRFSGLDAADGSSNIVFFQNARRMLQGLSGASTTRVELEFYRAGQQQLEFDTAELEWPRPAPTRGE